jgi:hypothetical protein
MSWLLAFAADLSGSIGLLRSALILLVILLFAGSLQSSSSNVYPPAIPIPDWYIPSRLSWAFFASVVSFLSLSNSSLFLFFFYSLVFVLASQF